MRCLLSRKSYVSFCTFFRSRPIPTNPCSIGVSMCVWHVFNKLLTYFLFPIGDTSDEGWHDPGLWNKAFIRDLMRGLKAKGWIIIPSVPPSLLFPNLLHSSFYSNSLSFPNTAVGMGSTEPCWQTHFSELWVKIIHLTDRGGRMYSTKIIWHCYRDISSPWPGRREGVVGWSDKGGRINTPGDIDKTLSGTKGLKKN